MKSMRFIVIILFSLFSYSQSYKVKLDEMIDLFNDENNNYKNIANELLNNKFGVIDNETKFYCEYFLGCNLINNEEYKNALDNYKELLVFCEKNEIIDSYSNLKKCVKDIKSRIKSLEIIIANLPNEIPTDNDLKVTSSENLNKNIIQETQKKENNVEKNSVNAINTTVTEQKISNTDNKTVTLTVTGTGKTLEEAKLNALRSAIEQAFGAFISYKTEILNDNLVKDEFVSIASGYIQKYNILNEFILPSGGFNTTLSATVSINKLISFFENKGGIVEFKGGLFSINIKQQILNEKAEEKVIYEMISLLHETLQKSFNYTIQAGDPKSIDTESRNFEIPLMISATANKNMTFCAKYFYDTLYSLSLGKSELETYKSLNKGVYSIIVDDMKINFRNETSIKAIKSIVSNWGFYIRLFAINSGLDEKFGGKIIDYKKLYSNILDDKGSDPHDLCVINNYIGESIVFPEENQVVATISCTDKRTLNELDQLNGYSVKPRGVVSNFKFGGYVVYQKNDHGLIVSVYDLGKELAWIEAKSALSKLNLNGFEDWRLPTKDELYFIYKNLFLKGIGNFYVKMYGDYGSTNYWTNEENNSYASYLWFKDGQFSVMDKYSKNPTRVVRSF